MRRISICIALVITFTGICAAQTILSSGAIVSQENAAGLDKLYVFDNPQMTQAPQGYEPFIIEHYGRHGSRYAYSSAFYSGLKKALDQGAERGVLTEFGKNLLERYALNYDYYMRRTGDLSDLGWEQQQKIAAIMYRDFPLAFKDAEVFATASSSTRSIMSMSAFCLGLCKVAPFLDIREEQGSIFLAGTNPRDERNCFPTTRMEDPFPFSESLDDFQQRRIDPDIILSRLFTDVDAACGGGKHHELVRDIYVLVSGMNSVPIDRKTDFSGIFTPEEYALMWEVDNYQRYIEYYVYMGGCLPVFIDMVEDAKKHIDEGTNAVTLRFGHDHVMMPLLRHFGVRSFEQEPSTTDEISACFKTWESLMATNIQLILYRKPAGEGDILVKFLLNGHEAELSVQPYAKGFYRWSDITARCERQKAKYPVITE